MIVANLFFWAAITKGLRIVGCPYYAPTNEHNNSQTYEVSPKHFLGDVRAQDV